jgi:hypothetical protein
MVIPLARGAEGLTAPAGVPAALVLVGPGPPGRAGPHQVFYFVGFRFIICWPQSG